MKIILRIIGLPLLIAGTMLLFKGIVTSLIPLGMMAGGLAMLSKSVSKFKPLK